MTWRGLGERLAGGRRFLQGAGNVPGLSPSERQSYPLLPSAQTCSPGPRPSQRDPVEPWRRQVVDLAVRATDQLLASDQPRTRAWGRKWGAGRDLGGVISPYTRSTHVLEVQSMKFMKILFQRSHTLGEPQAQWRQTMPPTGDSCSRRLSPGSSNHVL